MRTKLFAIVGIANCSLLLHATDGTWITNGSGDWLDGANWSTNPSAPTDPGDIARFITPGLTPNISVGISSSFDVGQIFIDGQTNYMIGPDNTIRLNNVGGQFPTIEVDNTNGNGSHTISSNVQLAATAAPMLVLINQNSTSPFTISGVISQTAADPVQYNGPGVLILSGNNTFTDLDIVGGTVSVFSQANLGATINPLFISNNATLQTTADFTMSRNIFLGAGGGTVSPDPGTTLKYSGIITSLTDNFTINGAGIFELDGTTALGGMIEVINGDLRVIGSLQTTSPSGLVIDSGGTVSGTSVGTDLFPIAVTNNGTISPGSAPVPGVMTLKGSLTQTSPTGKLAITYVDPSNFSQLNIIGAPGTADITGSSLEIIIEPNANVVLNTDFTILSTLSTLTGQFANVTTNSRFFMATAVYHDPGVDIFFTMAPPTMSLALSNSLVAAQAMTLANANQSANTASTATTQLHSRIESRDHAACNVSSLRTRFKRNDGYDMGLGFAPRGKRPDMFLANNSAMFAKKKDHEAETKEEQLKERIALPPPVPPGYHPARIYLGPTAGFGKAGRIDCYSTGGQVGFDYAFREIGIGLLLDYTHSHGKGFKADDAQATFYTAYVPHEFPQLSIDALIGGGYEWYLFHTLSDTFDGPTEVRGAPTGTEFNATFGMEYSFNDSQFTSMADNIQFMPAINLEYIQERVGKYREHGAAEFDMEFKQSMLKFLLFTMEAKMTFTIDWEDMSLIPLAYVGWQRDFLHQKNKAEFRFAELEDEPFTTAKLKRMGRNYAIAGIDIALYFYNKYGVEASYDYQYNRVFHDNKFYLGFNYLF